MKKPPPRQPCHICGVPHSRICERCDRPACYRHLKFRSELCLACLREIPAEGQRCYVCGKTHTDDPRLKQCDRCKSNCVCADHVFVYFGAEYVTFYEGWVCSRRCALRYKEAYFDEFTITYRGERILDWYRDSRRDKIHQQQRDYRAGAGCCVGCLVMLVALGVLVWWVISQVV